MLHQNVDLYICEHCRLEFYDEEECLQLSGWRLCYGDDGPLIQKSYERGGESVARRSGQCRKRVSSTRHSASCTT